MKFNDLLNEIFSKDKALDIFKNATLIDDENKKFE